MNISTMFAATVLLALVVGAATQGAEKESAAPAKFASAQIRFEQNATDGDVEAVFDIDGGGDGLLKLKVVAPGGGTVIDFTAPTAMQKAGAYGIRQFIFESPEPTDIAGLKSSYPAGEYTITGTTAKGIVLRSNARLDHTLPATTSFVFPKADADDVPTKNVTIKWAPVKGVAGYALELTREDPKASIEAKLPASATSFAVPEGFLIHGGDYQLGIGTISQAGNISFIETDFTTAAK